MAWRSLCVYQHAAQSDLLFITVSLRRIMSFSKKVHRSLTFVLFTLRPGHEIDVEILVQEEFPSLDDVFAIDCMKAVT